MTCRLQDCMLAGQEMQAALWKCMLSLEGSRRPPMCCMIRNTLKGQAALCSQGL